MKKKKIEYPNIDKIYPHSIHFYQGNKNQMMLNLYYSIKSLEKSINEIIDVLNKK